MQIRMVSMETYYILVLITKYGVNWDGAITNDYKVFQFTQLTSNIACVYYIEILTLLHLFVTLLKQKL